VLGAILLIVAMALVFPPLVFAGGLVLSALFGLFFSDSSDDATLAPPEKSGS
jgi:hypothetical protein